VKRILSFIYANKQLEYSSFAVDGQNLKCDTLSSTSLMIYDIFSCHKSLPDFIYLVEMVCSDVGQESCTNKEIGGVHYLHTHTETAPILFRKEQTEKRRMKVRIQTKQ
jgi:hypothetical protein